MRKVARLPAASWLVVSLLAAPASANLLSNSTFDVDIVGWDNPFFDPPENRAEWLGTDGGPISGPGCLEEGTTFNNAGSNGVYQDVPASPGDSFVVTGWSRIPNTSPGNGASLYVNWVDDMNNVVGSSGSSFNFDAGGGWFFHRIVVEAPAGTSFARVRPAIQTVDSGSEESVVRWDDLELLSADIFADGFETGSVGEWSTTSR